VTALDTHSGASPSTRGGGFPGFGDGAPLDLSSLNDELSASVLSRLIDGTHDDFAHALAHVGNCVRPIQLVGSSRTIDRTTGEVLGTFESDQAPMGVLMTPCGNRRASACPACSRVYARDTFELIRAGVVGGKTVPAQVSSAPWLFVTLTAPSFGHVHVHRDGRACRPRSADRVETCPHGVRLSCGRKHGEDDSIVGAPLCEDCYDWTSLVVWQWWAPELWRRTTIALRRALASRLDVKERDLRSRAALQFAKVAEYQARGLVHFHVLMRLDGSDGPGSTAPLDGDEFSQLVSETVPTVAFLAPPTDEHDAERLLRWGVQLDVRVVNAGGEAHHSDGLSPEQVAGYLAKYATKDAGDLRRTSDGDLLGRPHLRRIAAHCRELADRAHERERAWARVEHPERFVDLPDQEPGFLLSLGADGRDPYAHLAKWAHMLGFRGHFSTKSRRYSVTLGRLRRARERFRRALAESERRGEPLDLHDLEARLLAEDDEQTTLVVGSWTYADRGWPRVGDAVLAAAAAARAREYAQWRAEQRRS